MVKGSGEPFPQSASTCEGWHMFLSTRQMAGPAKHHFQNQWCFSFKIYRTRIEIRTSRKPTSIQLDNVEQERPDNPKAAGHRPHSKTPAKPGFPTLFLVP